MTQPHPDQASAGSATLCRTCGACCVTGGEVVVDAADLTPRHLTRSVRGRVGFASWEAVEFRRLHRIDGRCAAFRGGVGAACREARIDAGLPPP